MLTFSVVIVCIFLNGLFSAFEMAYVTIEADRLSDLTDRKKSLRVLTEWKKIPERILSIIQLGITFVGGLAAVVGGAKASKSLVPYLIQNYGFSHLFAEVLSVVVVILPLTYLNVVIGELVPKAIALRAPERVLNLGYPMIALMNKILYPFVSTLEVSTDFLLKLLRFNKKFQKDSPPKKVHIENLDDYHQRYILNLVGLKGKKNRDVYVDWDRVVHIDYGDSNEEVGLKVNVSRHTRLPVTDHGQVVGILNTKEFQVIMDEGKAFTWQALMRPVLKVSPDEKVLITFKRMQGSQTHMAIVQTDDDHILGIVTMENIIEQILGNIEDEDDDDRLRRMLKHKGMYYGYSSRYH